MYCEITWFFEYYSYTMRFATQAEAREKCITMLETTDFYKSETKFF